MPELAIPPGDVRWPLGGWLRRRPAPDFRFSGDVGGAAAYDGPKGLRVIVSLDITRQFGTLLHTSLSYASRDPTWAEIKALRQAFFPDTVDAMMMLPASQDYVNLHPHTFHVVQCPERWGLR